MEFKERKGKKYKEIKEFFDVNFSGLDDEVCEYKFDLEKLKINKENVTLNFFGNDVILEDRHYKYLTLKGMINKNSEILVKKIENTSKYENGLKNYDMNAVLGEIKLFLYSILKFYVMFSDDYDTDFVISEFSNKMGNTTEKLSKSYEEDSVKFRKELDIALDMYKQNLKTAESKAIGSEAGWLYGTSSYAGAAAGTYITKANLEADMNNAKKTYDSHMSSIKDKYNDLIQRRIYDYIEENIYNLLNVCFRNEYSDDELVEITNIHSDVTNSNLIDNFIKYPFVIKNYMSIIEEFTENDFKQFIKLCEFFDIKEIIHENLKLYIRNNYLKLEVTGNDITEEDITTNYFILYCKMNDLDIKKCVHSLTIDYLKKEIKKDIYSFNKLEVSADMATRVFLYQNVLTLKELEVLLEVIDNNYNSVGSYKIKLGDIIDDVKDSFIYISICSVLFFVVFLINNIINVDEVTFGTVVKNLVLSIIFGIATSVVDSLIEKLRIAKFKFNAFNYNNVIKCNSKGNKKAKIKVRLLLPIVMSILLVLCNKVSTSRDLNLYGITWSDGHTYIRFNENGYVEIAKEKVVGGYYSETYDLKKYKCTISLDTIEKEKKWYSRDYSMICDIDGEDVEIYGSILDFKGDYDTSLSVLCSDSDRPKWTTNPKSNYIYGYDKSYKDFDSLS